MDEVTLFQRLDDLQIETPSWGFANSGTRFGTFPQPWAARTLTEKLEDAAEVHRLTGICPRVALHIPWDKVEDWGPVKKQAADLGVGIGAINPNVFQDRCYQFGSLANPDPAVRRKAIDHHLECVRIAKATGSSALSLWYADGTNFPGQDDIRSRKRRFEAGLAEVYSALPAGLRMLVEYKPFEPAFYHTDIPDWGLAALWCRRLGPQAQVLVDLGHHLPGTNIEQIVAILLDDGLLGGFHFNNRKYADDDLSVGSINPYELFLIFCELTRAARDPEARIATAARAVAYMFDHCHNHKPTVEAVIQAALNVQEAYCKALLVDTAALSAAQARCDLVGAEECLTAAFKTDVRAVLGRWRAARNRPAEPLTAFRQSGYLDRRAAERQARHGAPKTGGGYQ